MASAGAAAARAHAVRQAKSRANDAAAENDMDLSPGGSKKAGGRKKKAVVTELAEKPTGIWKYQEDAKRIYQHIYCQVGVAGLIGGNFMMNLIEKTIDPAGEHYTDVFGGFELFFNIAFTIELVLNMYGSWWKQFWTSGWNVFDFVVVSIGLLTTFNVPLPGPFTMLRMMRAFRVFRLFKRVESLRKIMEALARAIPGVINAFLILLIVMCIYAILGVEFFRTFGAGGFYSNESGEAVALQTPRGSDYGEEYFGNFPKSLYTMFQVLTGESWSEAVARPLLHGPNVVDSIGVAFYFVSFIVVNGIILINVVVAVLLDKFVTDEEEEESEGEKKEEEEEEEADEEQEGVSDAAVAAKEEPTGKEEDTDVDKRLSRSGSATSHHSEEKHKKQKVTIGSAVREMRDEVDSMKERLSMVLTELEKNYPPTGLSNTIGSTTIGGSAATMPMLGADLGELGSPKAPDVLPPLQAPIRATSPTGDAPQLEPPAPPPLAPAVPPPVQEVPELQAAAGDGKEATSQETIPGTVQ